MRLPVDPGSFPPGEAQHWPPTRATLSRRCQMAARFGAREVTRLETVYASPAIATQRARTRAALGALPGERGLDVGCGPAFLACELGHEVGPHGHIVGLDESRELLEAARARI